MITKEEALTENHFHYGECTRKIGPRGGVTEKIIEVRRIGRTKTWVTRPTEWYIPVQYGFYGSGKFHLHESDAASYHLPKDCPLRDVNYATEDLRQKVG